MSFTFNPSAPPPETQPDPKKVWADIVTKPADPALKAQLKATANASITVGRTCQKILPDTFDARANGYPMGDVPLNHALNSLVHVDGLGHDAKRGIADLMGLGWGSLTGAAIDAIKTLDGEKTGIMIGFLAARAHVLAAQKNILPEGTVSNIEAATAATFDHYTRYNVQRLGHAFVPGAYAAGLCLMEAGDARATATMQGALETPYYDEFVRLDKLTKDADLLRLMLDDVNAFTHRLSHYFVLNREQERAFAVLFTLIGQPAGFGDGDPKGKSGLAHKRTAQSYKTPDKSYDVTDRIGRFADPVSSFMARLSVEEGYREELAHSARLAGRFVEKLRTFGASGYEGGHEEGLLDPAALTGLITDPTLTGIYRQQAVAKTLDTAITLLVDNSGSMGGEKIEMAYVGVRQISLALDRYRIPYEVLGYTTGTNIEETDFAEGRQTAVRHIIYKSFGDARMQQDELSGMLDKGIRGCNADGEALLWAAGRLSRRPEKRRILLNICDGQPVFSYKGPINPTDHLAAVAYGLERDHAIELGAIGIKHDVSPYYARSVRVDQAMQLPSAIVGVMDLLLRSRSPAAFARLQKQIAREQAPKKTATLSI